MKMIVGLMLLTALFVGVFGSILGFAAHFGPNFTLLGPIAYLYALGGLGIVVLGLFAIKITLDGDFERRGL